MKLYNYAVESAIINCLLDHEKNEDSSLSSLPDYQTEIRSLFDHEEGRITKVGMSAGRLRESVEQRLDIRNLSPDTFYNSRLKGMTEGKIRGSVSRYTVYPILERKFQGKGKKVFYSLTNDVKIRCRLGLSIFEVDTLKEIAYQLLFFYLQHRDISRSSIDFSQYKFTSEKQFHDFLSKIHLDEADFEIIDVRKDKEKGYYFKKMLHPKWNIIITCSKSNTNPISYVCNLPGISPHDKRIITGHVFEHILIQNGQTDYDIEKLFDLLEKEKIIYRIHSPILSELGETRYDIVDKNLKELIFDCWKIFGAVQIRMQYTWENFRRPNKEEIAWLKIIWGKARAAVLLRQYNQTRSIRIIKKHMKKERKERLQMSKDNILSDTITKLVLINLI